MHTTHSLLYRGGFPWTEIFQTDPLDRDCPDRDPLDRSPLEEHWIRDKDPPGRDMGPGSQTGSDIIQRPPPRGLTTAFENIALPQTSFSGGNKLKYEIRTEQKSWKFELCGMFTFLMILKAHAVNGLFKKKISPIWILKTTLMYDLNATISAP